MRHTETALRWIVGILNELQIPFEIDGGLAAELYGSPRELADIDINVPQENFEKIVPRVREYLTFGPGWYRDEHWECYMMTMKYVGQNIDVSALGHMRYFDKNAGAFVDFPADLSAARVMEYDGMSLPFINEKTLLRYKALIGRGVDRKDVRAMERELE
ncbi:hypothetical protein HY091_02975 [Candidatus Kaiserbacteria bacterium]|nr:hypothetical protein [Candidatus Kaiserbacteria bacterium]